LFCWCFFKRYGLASIADNCAKAGQFSSGLPSSADERCRLVFVEWLAAIVPPAADVGFS